MPVHNMEVAEKFNKLANLLEIEGANQFRVRAYRNAGRIIATLQRNIADMLIKGEDLTQLPGIGKDLAEKISVIIKTGELPMLTEIEKKLPPLLNELLSIEGLGPKRIQIIYKKLHIKKLSDLKLAIDRGQLLKLHGFGKKIQEKILIGIAHLNQKIIRLKLYDATSIVESITAHLKQHKKIKKIVCAGSFRRRKETIGDLDFIIVAENGADAIAHFLKFDEISQVLAKGSTRSTVRLHSGVQVDLRAVPDESFGAALLYFTGSKEHNIAIRKLALKAKLKINEYGVFKGKKQIAGKTEDDVYRQIKLPYIEPELREERGEIAAAKNHTLPKLIELKNIRGDLHCHTNATDGKAPIAEMVKAAKQLGYEYLAITDHSQRLAMVNGLDKKALIKQIREIDKLNAKLNNFIILKSIEVDILENGELDLPNDILKELDFTVCAIHSKFNLSLQKQTQRVLRAMDNPYFNIFAHPTGRIINERLPYAIDMERIMVAAKDQHCVLELDAQPNRLDINDEFCKLAKDAKVKIAISSDAHHPEHLRFMEFGIYQARRGWIEAADVVNTMSCKDLKTYLQKTK